MFFEWRVVLFFLSITIINLVVYFLVQQNIQLLSFVAIENAQTAFFYFFLMECLLLLTSFYFFIQKNSNFSYAKHHFRFYNGYKILVTFIFFVVLLIAIVVLAMLEMDRQEKASQNLKAQGVNLAMAVERRLEGTFYPVYAIGALVKQSHGHPAYFHELSKPLLRIYPYIRELNISPNGVISDMEPLINSEKVIGLNVLTRPEEMREANLAIQTGKFVLVGPIPLVQGGISLIGHLPIFLETKTTPSTFWGFATILVDFPQVLEQPMLFDENVKKNYQFQISQITLDGQKKVIYGDATLNSKIAQTFSIHIPNGAWTLTLVPKNNADHVIFYNILVAFCASMIVAFVIEKIFNIKSMEYEREHCFLENFAFNEACTVSETDPNGIIVHINDNFSLLTGYERHELVGKNHSVLRSGVQNDAFYHQLWQTILAGNIWRGELCNRKKNNELFWVYTVIVPIIDHKTQKIIKFVSITNDITATKHEQKEKEVLKNQLYHSQKLETIGQLTSGIAHDFNNILMAITGFSQAGNKHNRDGKPELATTCYERVQTSANRAVSLIQKMLIYTRQNTDNSPVFVSTTQLVEEVSSIVQMLRCSIGAHITVELKNLLTDHTLQVLIDPTELHQLMTNLVINARDAIELGDEFNGYVGVTIFHHTLHQETTCDACLKNFMGDYITISVNDTGIGIDPEKIVKIFDPFFTTKDVGKGTGLGLSVITGIMHNAGGHIILESTLGVGTTFSLVFPAVQISSQLEL